MISLITCAGLATLLVPGAAVVAPRSVGRAEAAFPARNGRIVFPVVQVGTGGEPLNSLGVNADLFTVSPSGKGLRRETEGLEDDYTPAWSPDGSRIAFVRSSRAAIAFDVFVQDMSTAEVTNLTQTPTQSETGPSWSPDGQHIVFARMPLQNFPLPTGADDLYMMSSDGSQPEPLTDSPGSEYDPVWSPAGDEIAYAFDNGTEDDGIYVMRPGRPGTELIVGIQRTGYQPAAPSWSPDGRRLTFSTFERDVWVVNRDGTGVNNVTAGHGVWSDYYSAWAPDGQWIAFMSERSDEDGGDTSLNLYKMRPDGSDVRKLIDISLAPENTPKIDWGPRP